MKILEIKELPSFIEVTTETTRGWFSKKIVQCKYYIDGFAVYTMINNQPEQLDLSETLKILRLYGEYKRALNNKETIKRLLNETRGN